MFKMWAPLNGKHVDPSPKLRNVVSETVPENPCQTVFADEDEWGPCMNILEGVMGYIGRTCCAIVRFGVTYEVHAVWVRLAFRIQEWFANAFSSRLV